MPTYSYQCSKCGHEFELFQSMKAAPLSICPKDQCGQKRWGRGHVSRLLGTGAGIIFKGSGFYTTDYRSENYMAAAKKESGGDATPAPAKSDGGKPADAAAAKKAETQAGKSKPADA